MSEPAMQGAKGKGGTSGRSAPERSLTLVPKSRDAGSVPISNVLVEGKGAVEHLLHGRDAGSVPVANGLVEGRGAVEHSMHGRDAGSVPVANGLVEGRGAVEHSAFCRLSNRLTASLTTTPRPGGSRKNPLSTALHIETADTPWPTTARANNFARANLGWLPRP